MSIGKTCFLVAGTLAIWTGAQGAAAAQAVTYVSMAGDDRNSCRSIDRSCSSVESAISRLPSGGSVIIQGPYTTLSPVVDRPVSIIANGTALFVSLIVRESANNVKVTGVTFAGGNAYQTGARFEVASNVIFVDCKFEGYLEAALPVTGPAGTRVAMERVTITGNNYGVVVQGASGGANTVFIKDSFIDRSAASAVEVRGAANAVVLINSTLSGSGGLDLSRINGGRAVSYGNNVVRSGTPSQTLPNN